jgi:hypothetical protein
MGCYPGLVNYWFAYASKPMSQLEESPTYVGDKYRHTRSGFSGMVVKEAQPSPWLPETVILTLEGPNGEQRAFPLAELEEEE